MARIVIYKKRSMDADIAVSGLRYVVPPKMTFEVEVDFDSKVIGQVEKDSVLLKEMNEAAGESRNAIAQLISASSAKRLRGTASTSFGITSLANAGS